MHVMKNIRVHETIGEGLDSFESCSVRPNSPTTKEGYSIVVQYCPIESFVCYYICLSFYATYLHTCIMITSCKTQPIKPLP